MASTGDVERLKRYWAFGEGGRLIGWPSPGDHTRCVQLVQEAIAKGGGKPMSDHEAHGFCTNIQKMATGSARDASDSPQGNRGHG